MRTHVVTGAASGIGRQVVLRLAARGDRLILPVHSERRIAPLAAELRAVTPGPGAGGLPAAAQIVVVDLADPAAVTRFTQHLLAAGTGTPGLDRIDSLLHVAGVVALDTVAELEPADWQRTLAVNLTAPALLTRGLLPALRAGRGTVVFVNSGSGLRANPAWSAYAASKFGLRGLAEALRAEEAEHGVRVTSVFPGRTASAMQERVHAQEGREYDAAQWIAPTTVADAILHVLDLPQDATIPELVIRPN